MSGFSTSRSSIDNISKQYGSILRGWGPPVPKAGVLGDLYIDNLTFQLFEKRAINTLNDWGHYLFVVPSPYRNSLKWFGASRPSNIIGVPGDYFLHWSGYDDYGMQPTIFGPKLIFGWPENGDGPGTGTAIVADAIRPLGLEDEGPVLADMAPTVLIATGLLHDYIVPATVTSNQGDLLSQVGVPNTGQLVLITLNPLYTAEDEHAL